MMNMKYEISRTICTNCSLCDDVCPSFGTIIEKDSKHEIVNSNCIECGHCAAICPENAILCDGENLKELESVMVEQSAIRSLIHGKRSIRNYQKKDVEEKLLAELSFTAASTATASNQRYYKLTYIKGEEVFRASYEVARAFIKLFNMMDNPFMRAIAPLFGLQKYLKKEYLDPFRNSLKETMEKKQDRIFFNAPVVAIISFPKSGKSFGKTDSALAAAHLMLEARTLGLESCIIGFAERVSNKKRVAKALKLEKDMVAGIIFTLGYPKFKYKRVPKRDSI